MSITPANFGDPQVLALLRMHLAGMHANSPPEHVHALDLSGLQHPSVSFFALWDAGQLQGFGAIKEIAPRHGELKSMRTAEAHLRKGVAAKLLVYLLDVARTRGYARVSLETGSGPAFEPAITLYQRHGFTFGHAFGNYTAGEFSQFMHLDL